MQGEHIQYIQPGLCSEEDIDPCSFPPVGMFGSWVKFPAVKTRLQEWCPCMWQSWSSFRNVLALKPWNMEQVPFDIYGGIISRDFGWLHAHILLRVSTALKFQPSPALLWRTFQNPGLRAIGSFSSCCQSQALSLPALSKVVFGRLCDLIHCSWSLGPRPPSEMWPIQISPRGRQGRPHFFPGGFLTVFLRKDRPQLVWGRE